jgi:uncharacterized membrane protein
MRNRIAYLFDALRTGFWFLPSLMLGLAAALALTLLYVDERVDPGIKGSIAWAYSGGPEGARSLLSTIAGSMITAASVTFSLAAVALSIASQQYGSRVLRNFMRDRITQVLLGTFVSTFLYSVLVVRDIRGSEFSGGFVPAIAITVAIVLSLISLVMLVYFVHHVSSSIQASHIVSTIWDDMEEAIPKLYPSGAGSPVSATASAHEVAASESRAIRTPKDGYLQTIDLDILLETASKSDLFIKVLSKPGDHLVRQMPIATVSSTLPIEEEAAKRILGAFMFGKARTPAQDVRYHFQQLTDVVVRALSPGINDPFTAINGIDVLASALSLLARCPRIEEQRRGDQGTPRLFVPVPKLHNILKATVGHIAIYAKDDPFVMAKLWEVLNVIEPDLTGPDEQKELRTLKADLRHKGQDAKQG